MKSDDQVLALEQGLLTWLTPDVRPKRLSLARRCVRQVLVLGAAGHTHAAASELVLLDSADDPMASLSLGHAPSVFDVPPPVGAKIERPRPSYFAKWGLNSLERATWAANSNGSQRASLYWNR